MGRSSRRAIELFRYCRYHANTVDCLQTVRITNNSGTEHIFECVLYSSAQVAVLVKLPARGTGTYARVARCTRRRPSRTGALSPETEWMGRMGNRPSVRCYHPRMFFAAVVALVAGCVTKAAAGTAPHITFFLVDVRAEVASVSMCPCSLNVNAVWSAVAWLMSGAGGCRMQDLGWNDVSMHGSDQIPTPNIDHLAATGQRLNNYYVNPVCSPTRASLMSGRSVIHHGVFTPYGSGDDASGLNLTYTLLPAHLKNEYGYATYMVGKVIAIVILLMHSSALKMTRPDMCVLPFHQWHLGQKSPAYLPSHRGFDRYYGYYQGVMDYWTHSGTAEAGDPEHDPERGRIPSTSNVTKTGGPVINGGLDLHVGGADFGTEGQLDHPVWNASGQYSSDLFANVAGDWIVEHGRTKSTQPMFLYLAFQGCHSVRTSI